MKFEVNKELCEKTNCNFDYSCLFSGACGERFLCEAITAIYKDGLMLEKQEVPGICFYHKECKFGAICICPVRFAIYQKYRI